MGSVGHSFPSWPTRRPCGRTRRKRDAQQDRTLARRRRCKHAADTELLGSIEFAWPAVEAIEGERDVDNAGYVDGIAEENVRMVIAEIRRESPVLATMEQEREIRIVGGMYDVSTGAVRFI